MADDELKAWHQRQVELFYDTKGNRDIAAEKLVAVMQEITRRTDSSAIVQGRSKSLASFAEKVIRKKDKYTNPLEQLTDLVGGRIITYTQAGSERVCQYIESLDSNLIEIDWDNSENTTVRLRPEEFGYRAMHYIVQLKPPNVLGVPLENWMGKYKIEIQICTMMQHVWAAIGHDRVYKTQLTVDDSLKRRLSAISALIETAQIEFERGIEDIDRYREGALPQMDANARNETEMIYESVIAVEPFDSDAHLKCGDLHASVEQWQEASEHYTKCADSTPGVLTKRGRVAERLGDIKGAVKLYEQAADQDRRDWSVRCDLADLEQRQGKRARAITLYQEAFHIAPEEPRVLTRYVTALICEQESLACTSALQGALDVAIKECENRAALGFDIPKPFLQAARCHLLKGDLKSALDMYCKASVDCNSPLCFETELRDIKDLREHAGGVRHSFDCVVAVLNLLSVVISRRLRAAAQLSVPQAALLGKNEEAKRLKEVSTSAANNKQKPPSFKKRPIVIVAGGCDKNVEERMRAYQTTLEAGFQAFRGTLICGGTTAGISGLIGAAASKRGTAVDAIGYLPEELPEGDQRDDANYHNYEVAGTSNYSQLGPIQTWADLLLAGVDPATVRILGINGGELSAFEFRLGIAMGAVVGLVEDSGRAASTLLSDHEWNRYYRVVKLFNEAETIAAFVCVFCPTFNAIKNPALRKEKIDAAARKQHKAYRQKRLSDEDFVHSSVLPWDDGLHESYKESSRQQVEYADQILRTEGFTIVLINDPRDSVNLSAKQYEEIVWRMAPLEHGRFNAERLADGWQVGPERSVKNKTSPYLKLWDQLPKDVQQWDCDPFRKLAAILKTLGLKIVKMK